LRLIDKPECAEPVEGLQNPAGTLAKAAEAVVEAGVGRGGGRGGVLGVFQWESPQGCREKGKGQGLRGEGRDCGLLSESRRGAGLGWGAGLRWASTAEVSEVTQ
jgi:hypothetical protein